MVSDRAAGRSVVDGQSPEGCPTRRGQSAAGGGISRPRRCEDDGGTEGGIEENAERPTQNTTPAVVTRQRCGRVHDRIQRPLLWACGRLREVSAAVSGRAVSVSGVEQSGEPA